MKQKKNIKGFTLTEMIVVIAIIGILAAVLIPSVVIYVQRAQKSNDEQLAASMTDEIERYCIENDIEQEDLLGTDIRTILNFKGIDTTPKRNKWTFVYDIETKVVSVVELSAIQVDGSHKFVDPTNYREGYYLLGKGESKIEEVVNTLCRAQSLSSYQKACVLAEGNAALTSLVQFFNPDHTLYISNTNVFASYNENGEYKLTNVVFTETTIHIPTYIGSNIYKKDVSIDFKKTSAILKTIEKGSELLNQFSNLKVMDESNLIMLNNQFTDDIDDLFEADNDENISSLINPSFVLGENIEVALFTTFTFVPVEVKVGVDGKKHTILRLTINYYNENGLYARAESLYTK